MGRQNDGSIRLFLALCCWEFGILSFLGIWFLAWTFKDGLGPDSVESHGWLAWERAFKGAGWFLLIPAALMLLGFFVLGRLQPRPRVKSGPSRTSPLD